MHIINQSALFYKNNAIINFLIFDVYTKSWKKEIRVKKFLMNLLQDLKYFILRFRLRKITFLYS